MFGDKKYVLSNLDAVEPPAFRWHRRSFFAVTPLGPWGFRNWFGDVVMILPLRLPPVPGQNKPKRLVPEARSPSNLRPGQSAEREAQIPPPIAPLPLELGGTRIDVAHCDIRTFRADGIMVPISFHPDTHAFQRHPLLLSLLRATGIPLDPLPVTEHHFCPPEYLVFAVPLKSPPQPSRTPSPPRRSLRAPELAVRRTPQPVPPIFLPWDANHLQQHQGQGGGSSPPRHSPVPSSRPESSLDRSPSPLDAPTPSTHFQRGRPSPLHSPPGVPPLRLPLPPTPPSPYGSFWTPGSSPGSPGSPTGPVLALRPGVSSRLLPRMTPGVSTASLLPSRGTPSPPSGCERRDPVGSLLSALESAASLIPAPSASRARRRSSRSLSPTPIIPPAHVRPPPFMPPSPPPRTQRTPRSPRSLRSLAPSADGSEPPPQPQHPTPSTGEGSAAPEVAPPAHTVSPPPPRSPPPPAAPSPTPSTSPPQHAPSAASSRPSARGPGAHREGAGSASTGAPDTARSPGLHSVGTHTPRSQHGAPGGPPSTKRGSAGQGGPHVMSRESRAELLLQENHAPFEGPLTWRCLYFTYCPQVTTACAYEATFQCLLRAGSVWRSIVMPCCAYYTHRDRSDPTAAAQTPTSQERDIATGMAAAIVDFCQSRQNPAQGCRSRVVTSTLRTITVCNMDEVFMQAFRMAIGRCATGRAPDTNPVVPRPWAQGQASRRNRAQLWSDYHRLRSGSPSPPGSSPRTRPSPPRQQGPLDTPAPPPKSPGGSPPAPAPTALTAAGAPGREDGSEEEPRLREQPPPTDMPGADGAEVMIVSARPVLQGGAAPAAAEGIVLAPLISARVTAAPRPSPGHQPQAAQAPSPPLRPIPHPIPVRLSPLLTAPAFQRTWLPSSSPAAPSGARTTTTTAVPPAQAQPLDAPIMPPTPPLLSAMSPTLSRGTTTPTSSATPATPTSPSQPRTEWLNLVARIHGEDGFRVYPEHAHPALPPETVLAPQRPSKSQAGLRP
ncbi:hypothetical protein PAPYR_5335 [Paratrimastix pyriformis]|uniref:Uncharacterized protein n=1 Tax=Paratrimastix pyriformis TaxID=342808 RepID=A0ABQ8UHV6_9EUKA|nr:hypothetical protein PAPYR_5335 [Paratrimastix pyriformis]